MTTRRRTHDRMTGAGPPGGVGGMHTTEQIGPKRHRTPEGYLLCEDVCLARTGAMFYGPGETPVKTNDRGYAVITRDEATLFNPVTMMSFSGKPVTNDHPYGGVTPRNYKQVSVGTVLNVRRGTGDDADTMRGDLLIKDAQAIFDVEAGKREVSAGYEADYQTTGLGEGRQIHIIGNHIALVKSGRCGPRCAIGDRQPSLSTRKGNTMPTATRKVSDAQRASIMALLGPDEDDNEDDDNDAGHVHVHLHNGQAGAAATTDASTMDAAIDARFGAMEESIGELTKAVTKLITGDKAGTGQQADETDDTGAGATGDSKALETGFKALVADAEVLVPGFKVPTFDAAAQRKATVDSMCAIRRKVLDTVGMTAEGSIMLATVTGKTIDTMTMDCAAVAETFRVAAGARRLMNNGSSTAGAGRVAVSDAAAAAAAFAALPIEKRGPRNVAELNEMHRKMFPLG